MPSSSSAVPATSATSSCAGCSRPGYRVKVLDRLIFEHGSAIAPLLEHPRFSLVHGDMRDPGRSRPPSRASPTSRSWPGWSATRSPGPIPSSPTRSTSTDAPRSSRRSTGAGSTISCSPRPAATTDCAPATISPRRRASYRRSPCTPSRRSRSSAGSWRLPQRASTTRRRCCGSRPRTACLRGCAST